MVWKDNHKVFRKNKWNPIKRVSDLTMFFSRTCAKLAYQDAQVVIEGGELPSDVILFDGHDGAGIAYDIQLLQRLSVHMRKRRYENGSLSLNSVKLQFELDQFGAPVEVTAFEAKEANRLIEEFMLQANISVASKILSTFPEEALLRRHQDPTERRLVKEQKTEESQRN